MRRARVIAFVLVVGIGLVWAPYALAGSDIYSNIAPGSQVPGGGLADRYPLSHYALDKHFKAVEASLTGGVDFSGVPAMIAYFLASMDWGLSAFLANALIDVFTFAFSLDLVNGSEATGGVGALEPVARAIRTLYANTFGEPWLVVAVVLVGMWALWRGLVQRRYTETAGALGTSLLFLVIAMAFVTQPERTIGEASRWTNQMSTAFLALSRGSISDEQDAKRAASDQLFELLIHDPWVVLNFGGAEHCVRSGTGDEKSDPVSVAVRPLSPDPRRDRALRNELRTGTQVEADDKTCINNRRKYAARFLRHSLGSDARDAEYQALQDGDTNRLPKSQRSREYRLGPPDKPATDAMEQDGQVQRMLLAFVVILGELGAFLLLGALSVGVILAQVVVLLLLAFAPVALVIGVFPGRGHDFFRAWLIRLAGFLARKAIYSLILAVLLAVTAAVGDATSTLGWLLSFGLQAAFFWSVVIWRHQLTGQLLTATTGTAQPEGRPALETLAYARSIIRRAGRPRRGGAGGGPPPGSGPPPSPPRAGGGAPHTPDGSGPPPPSRPPARAHDHTAAGPPTGTSQGAQPAATNQPRTERRDDRKPQDGPPEGSSPEDARRGIPPRQPEPAPLADSDAHRPASRPADPTVNPAESPRQRGEPEHRGDKPSGPDTGHTAHPAPPAGTAPGEPAPSAFAAGEASNPLLAALRRDRERLARLTAKRRARRQPTPSQQRGDKR